MQKMYNYTYKLYVKTGKNTNIIITKLRKSIAKLVQILQNKLLIVLCFWLLVFPFKIPIKREKTGRKGALITY